jgi:hypothetical protein
MRDEFFHYQAASRTSPGLSGGPAWPDALGYLAEASKRSCKPGAYCARFASVMSGRDFHGISMSNRIHGCG